MNKKNILILGASDNQINLIKAAKEQGYRTVVCDSRPSAPGIKYADIHYLANTMDREAVLEVAKKEKVDGVISNSEPAMPNVAYIATELGLIGNSPQGIETLLSKEAFRKAQSNIGLYSPKQIAVNSREEFFNAVNEIGLPIIIKPVVSSASRGNTTVKDYDKIMLEDAYNECNKHSRNGKVAVEKYIEMPDLTMLEVEVFVCDGRYFFGATFSDIHSPLAPKMPKIKEFPLKLTPRKMTVVEYSVKKLFESMGIKHGEYNVEMYFTNEDELFIVEINPRQGGNSIPKLIKYSYGIDMSKLLVTTAVGDNDYFNRIINSDYKADFITGSGIFSLKNGIYKRLCIDPEIKPYIIETQELKKYGERVNKVENAEDTVAFVILKFNSADEQNRFGKNIDEYIYPIVEE